MTVACSVCRYANHLSFPSFCPVLCMVRFPTASEGNASISRGYRTEGDRAAPWSVHSSPQRIKAAQALIVSGFGHWKGSLKTSLRLPGAPARPVQSAPRGGGRSWCWFPGCRLCAHGTRLVRSAQTQRVTVYLQCEFVFRVKCCSYHRGCILYVLLALFERPSLGSTRPKPGPGHLADIVFEHPPRNLRTNQR